MTTPLPHLFLSGMETWEIPQLPSLSKLPPRTTLYPFPSTGSAQTLTGRVRLGSCPSTELGISRFSPALRKQPWMRRIQPFHAIKTNLRCDSWIKRIPSPLNLVIRQIAEHAVELIPPLSESEIE